jgi:hypothetical protein
MPSIAVVGNSGEGKSTSYGQIPELGIKGLSPKETVVINVGGKDLPFRGWQKLYSGEIPAGGNYFHASEADKIAMAIKFVSENRKEVKNIVIDDGQFIMGFEFMRRAKESGYAKFADIGVNIAKVIEAARTSRPDLKVYFLWHPEKDNTGKSKMKTVGKMVDDHLTLEGLFTVVLYTKVERGTDNKVKYQFVTNNDGEFPAKSPFGMFKDLYVPNDLGLISEQIDKYNSGE